MVLKPNFHLLNQLGPISLMLLFSACSTVTTIKQPSVEDKSTPSTSTVKPTPSPSRSSTQEQPNIADNTTTAPIIEQQYSVPVAPKTSSPIQQNPAVIALIDSAQQQQQNGDLYSAQTSLQRAQRIAPRDPQVYYELANIHRELQDYALAEQVALKGVSIVQGQPQQLRRFWILISLIRTDAGDNNGANEARKIAERY